MSAFVVDCSVTMTWLFRDETTPATVALLDRLDVETAVVPSIWRVEITNIVALAERKGRITLAESQAFFDILKAIDIETDIEGSAGAFTQILPLCRLHRLTSYDALYLELALRRNLPLASLDKDLRRVGTQLGVTLLGL